MAGHGGRTPEGFPAGHPEVASVSVSQPVKGFDSSRHLIPGGHHDVEIDDGFRRESGHGGASDVSVHVHTELEIRWNDFIPGRSPPVRPVNHPTAFRPTAEATFACRRSRVTKSIPPGPGAR